MSSAPAIPILAVAKKPRSDRGRSHVVRDIQSDRILRSLYLAVVTRTCDCPDEVQPCTHAFAKAHAEWKARKPGNPGLPSTPGCVDGYAESKSPSDTTDALPGTDEKIEVMSKRFRRGESCCGEKEPRCDSF